MLGCLNRWRTPHVAHPHGAIKNALDPRGPAKPFAKDAASVLFKDSHIAPVDFKILPLANISSNNAIMTKSIVEHAGELAVDFSQQSVMTTVFRYPTQFPLKSVSIAPIVKIANWDHSDTTIIFGVCSNVSKLSLSFLAIDDLWSCRGVSQSWFSVVASIFGGLLGSEQFASQIVRFFGSVPQNTSEILSAGRLLAFYPDVLLIQLLYFQRHRVCVSFPTVMRCG